MDGTPAPASSVAVIGTCRLLASGVVFGILGAGCVAPIRFSVSVGVLRR